MKVLWISNGPTEEIQYDRNGVKEGVVSWVSGLLEFIRDKDITIDVLYMGKKNQEFHTKKINNTTYYGFMCSNKAYLSNLKNQPYFESVLKQNYDIIHFFGTEYYHSLEIFNMIDDKSKILISIQGLCSVIEKHFLLGVPNRVIKRKSIRDILRKDGLHKQKLEFIRRGKNEIEILSNAVNVVGRTDWDKACTFFINENRKYYFANEILRKEFYNNSWSWETCDLHSIFLSQIYSPLKGFHILLEAAGILKKYFPDLIIRTTGEDFIHDNSFKCKIRHSSYQKYIIELVKKHNLEDNIEFLGFLSEARMIEEYKRSNVFVSASSIENSPNSVAEAMVLGVPSVVSDVGGVKNLLIHQLDGFIYPADEPYMLAYYVKELFDDKKLALKFSKNAQIHAKKTHNPTSCADDMYKIYLDIIKKNKTF